MAGLVTGFRQDIGQRAAALPAKGAIGGDDAMIGRDHPEVTGEQRDLRRPLRPAHPTAVQQDQRLAVTAFGAVQGRHGSILSHS